jgi:hypothetical protein
MGVCCTNGDTTYTGCSANPGPPSGYTENTLCSATESGEECSCATPNVIDDGGICGGNDLDKDCTLTCFGESYYNDCGDCVLLGDDTDQTCIQGCDGVSSPNRTQSPQSL